MYKLKIIIIGFCILFIVSSCKTYTIPTESFRTQMKEARTDNMTEVSINNPLNYGNITYFSNDIKSLIVVDKNGNIISLNNSPSIEMRVTHKNGKKYHFYFDTVILENDTLKGGRSRFIQSLIRKIPMDSISKIEVQDGGKKFNYEN